MSVREFTYAGFSEYVSEHKLMGTRCACDKTIQLPPRPFCPTCPPEAIEWVELGGTGKLLAFSVIYVGTTPMINAGFDRRTPYCVGIVQLDEGPAISGLILGVDVLEPEKIRVGAPVQADFVELGPAGSKKTVLAFRAV
jgi:uncharacterized protein